MGHMQNNLLQCPTFCVTLLIIWFFFFDKSDFCGICDTFLSKCHAKNSLFLKYPWNCVAQYMIILYMPQKSHKRPKSWSQSDPFSISAWHFLRKFHICHSPSLTPHISRVHHAHRLYMPLPHAKRPSKRTKSQSTSASTWAKKSHKRENACGLSFQLHKCKRNICQ